MGLPVTKSSSILNASSVMDPWHSWRGNLTDTSIVSNANVREIEPVDALQFITSSKFLSESPTPFQRLVLKTFYELWLTYPPDDEEKALLELMEKNWHLMVDLTCQDPITTLLMALGRRATKSTIMSFLATYAAYRLICKDNPQQKYGIRLRHPIFITHVAAKEDQASAVFRLTSDNIRRVEFFRPYIDFDKDSQTELRLYTPYDVRENQKIRERNALIPRGQQKETYLPGSIHIKSITTSATTNRGDATYLLMLSELAHFQRSRMTNDEIDDIENPRTDYAIVKALTPAVKDFGYEGKVVMESSPAEKGGQFYQEYCIGGGCEQEEWESVKPERGYQVIQLATWEARPTITREFLDPEFRKDPRGAESEYGAHFSNPSAQFIPEAIINAIPQVGRPMLLQNPGPLRFFMSLDPGGKAKVKAADTYAISWGHIASDMGPESTFTYWIDGMHGFDAQVKVLPNGRIERIPVDPNVVIAYVVNRIEALGGRNYILEIVYDQFESSSPVAMLQSMGLPAIETTFTNEYKGDMYGNFLAKAQLGQVKMYGIDVDGWVARWKLEMKYLQQDIHGMYTFYHHPDTGPVRHDDFADSVANLVHRMCLRAAPTKESIKDARKEGLGPMQRRTTVRPIRGPNLSGTAPQRPFMASSKNFLRDR
jgi:hypothetical protein